MFKMLSTAATKASINNYIKRQSRNLSKGSLAGGFNESGLQRYAEQLWNEDHEDNNIISDLSSQKLSLGCCQWLDTHDDTSGELAKAYFGSPRFLPERILLSPLFLMDQTSSINLPQFKEHDGFLAWKVCSKSPLEIICSWENSIAKSKGLTMMAFDPKLQRLYHGNSLFMERETMHAYPKTFSLLNDFHIWYAKFLLAGMANELEHRAS